MNTIAMIIIVSMAAFHSNGVAVATTEVTFETMAQCQLASEQMKPQVVDTAPAGMKVMIMCISKGDTRALGR